jgi:UDP-GlcNAc:undecaprenyl-phosphate/decaprenyl-phosphate GlcNAc-1-phosphate transferase
MLDAPIFLTGALVAWALVRGLRQWAPRLGLLDQPNQRSMHRQQTPRGGGAAIVIVCLLGIGIAAAVGLRPRWSVLLGYVAGALLIAGVSWADDVRSVPFGLRLAAQSLAAALLLIGLGIQTDAPSLFGHIGPGWLVVGLSLLWTVGFTNAYNFMDGIDGLAATQGTLAGLGWTVVATFSNQPWIALLALLSAAGCLGFLGHNWPPARVFMGDVGSAFLGFTFAFITLAAAQRAFTFLFVGAVLLWPFIFDSAFTMFRRLSRGENVFVAHRSHLYQRLVLSGWQQAAVAALYGLFALVTLALGVVWSIARSASAAISVIVVVVLLSLGLWALVSREERRANKGSDPRPLMGR